MLNNDKSCRKNRAGVGGVPVINRVFRTDRTGDVLFEPRFEREEELGSWRYL